MTEQLILQENINEYGVQRIRLTNVFSLNLKGLTLDFPFPGLSAITGPSGSGKTALLLHTIHEEARKALTPGMSFHHRRRLARPLLSQVQHVVGLRPTIDLGELVQSYAQSALPLADVLEIRTQLQRFIGATGSPKCQDAACALEPAGASDTARVLASATFLRQAQNGGQDRGVIVIVGVTPLPSMAIASKVSKKKRMSNAENQRALAMFLQFFSGQGYQRFLVNDVFLRVEDSSSVAVDAQLQLSPIFTKPQSEIGVITAVLPITQPTEADFVEVLNREFQEASKAGFPKALVLWLSGREALRDGESLSETQVRFRREVFDGYKCESCGCVLAAADVPRAGSQRDFPKATNSRLVSMSFAGMNLQQCLQQPASKLLEQFLQLDRSGLGNGALATLERLLQGLGRLDRAGLGRIPLSRPLRELSDGERVKVACHSFPAHQTAELLFLFDEPSRILHPADLVDFRHWVHDQVVAGNGVIVAERDEGFISSADEVVRLRLGGTLESVTEGVHVGPSQKSQKATIEVARNASRAPGSHKSLDVEGIAVPLQRFVVLVGRAGSGKTRFLRAIERAFLAAPPKDSRRKVFMLSASAPATDANPARQANRPQSFIDSMKLLDDVSEVYARLPLARQAGFSAKTFSLHEPQSRCAECLGAGVIYSGADFVGYGVDICPNCGGQRYDERVLVCEYNGCNIADVFSMTVADSIAFFVSFPDLVTKLQAFFDLGLGQIQLGESLQTLPWNIQMRIRLAESLSKRNPSKSLLLLDQTLANLDEADFFRAVSRIRKFVQEGGTVVLTTHEHRAIHAADSLIECRLDSRPKLFLESREYSLEYFSFLRQT